MSSIVNTPIKITQRNHIYFKDTRFGDIIRGQVTAKTDELLAAEECSIDVFIPAIIELRSRLKQAGLLWEIYPYHRLWYYVFFTELMSP